MRSIALRAVAAALGILGAAPLAALAQSPAPRLQATPRVGMMVPYHNATVRGPEEAIYTFGLTAELSLPASPVDLRAGLEFAPAYDARIRPSACSAGTACRNPAACASACVANARVQFLHPAFRQVFA